MHASKKHPHHTPCGLSRNQSATDNITWNAFCLVKCPFSQRPFCFDEPDAVTCQAFALSHGFRRLTTARPALNSASLLELDNPQRLF